MYESTQPLPRKKECKSISYEIYTFFTPNNVIKVH